MANWDVTTAAASLEFDTVLGQMSTACIIDSNHFINFWSGNGSDGFVQVFEVNTTTWAVTTANASLEFDTQNGVLGSSAKIDDNHFIYFYGGLNNDGYVQVFEVNTTTWAVTTAGANLEFDTVNGTFNSAVQIDGNHFINFWRGNGSDGFVQVFEVNTTTWAVTTVSSTLEFETTDNGLNCAVQIDDNHFINFWSGAGIDGFVQVFEVNTTTWAVTTANASLEFDTVGNGWNTAFKIDTNHFINFWSDGVDNRCEVQVFEVNTTTWAVTTAGGRLDIDLDVVSGQFSIYPIDANHFITFRSGDGLNTDGYTQVFEVNTTTWAVTTSAGSLEFDTVNNTYNSCLPVDSSHFINFWSGEGNDGYVQVFAVEVPSSGNNYTDDLVDSEGLTDTISKQSASTRPLVDSLGLTDTINLTNTIVRSLNDNVGLTDSLGDGDVITRSLVDSIGLTDSISSSKSQVISLADSIGITDSLLSSQTHSVTLGDSLGITDAISSVSITERALSDSLGITDSLGDQDVIFRSLNDSVGITDSNFASQGHVASLSDSIGITDSILSIQNHSTSLSDNIGITDSLLALQSINTNLVDAVGVTDSLQPSTQTTRGLVDSMQLTDTLNALSSISRSIADSIGLTDSLTSEVITPSESTYTYIQHAYFGAMYYGSYTTMLSSSPALVDSVGITDTIQTQTTYVVSLSDSVGVTDTITESSVTIRELQDDEGITDTNNVGILHARSLADGVGITDEVIPVMNYLISIADDIGITDDIDATKAIVVSLQDAVGITDEGAVIGLLLTRELQDDIGIVDNIISTLIYKKRSIVSGEIDNFKISLSSVDNIPVKMGSISDIKLKLAEIEDK